MDSVHVKRLGPGDARAAGVMFAKMAAVFGEDSEPLEEGYVDDLLGRDSFWAMAAFVGTEIVGGLTAHTLPMTRSSSSELFIFDLAVREDHRRQGVASLLLRDVRSRAAVADIPVAFVPAEDEDVHAFDFYRAQGGAATAVTFFTFTA